ncbi:hypothetical protein L1987_54864 [Smallanthus sonchifolius]|uniref:Uncharacterized protein n=1 Tax=Smallanthus sonchifolius TaxID=185202 RepID=A0ACB9E8F0_9ASTR|nr:hypothetical protein L1987_54864 [Smallanthus sonchifolius]
MSRLFTSTITKYRLKKWLCRNDLVKVDNFIMASGIVQASAESVQAVEKIWWENLQLGEEIKQRLEQLPNFSH